MLSTNRRTATLVPSRFPLGRVLATPGALGLLDRCGISPVVLLRRHQCGDWGELDIEDRQANAQALALGARLLSAYPVGSDRLWIITEADRSATTLLLPEEY